MQGDLRTIRYKVIGTGTQCPKCNSMNVQATNSFCGSAYKSNEGKGNGCASPEHGHMFCKNCGNNFTAKAFIETKSI